MSNNQASCHLSKMGNLKDNPIKRKIKCTEYSRRKYPIPTIKTRLLHKINSSYRPELVHELEKYAFDYSSLDESQFGKVKPAGLMSALVYPFGDDPDRFATLWLYYVLLLINDDHHECCDGVIDLSKEQSMLIWTQLDGVLEKLCSDKFVSMIHWKPWITAIYAIFEVMYKDLNAIQRQRMTEALKRLIAGNKEEILMHGLIDKMTDLDDFIEIRLRCAGDKAAYVPIEYCRQIYVPEQEWNSEKFQQLLQIWSRFNVFINDLCSYERESRTYIGKENKMMNVVTFICNMEGLNISESMEKVARLIENLENEFILIKEELLNETNISEDLIQFIEGLEYFCAGNLHAHLTLDRYNDL